MLKNKDDLILVKNVYLFYDFKIHKLVGASQFYPHALPFICSPKPETASERYAFKMYPTNNLYYIISNGGEELTAAQTNAINK